MSVDDLSAGETAGLPARPMPPVTISPWINQRFPPLNEILSAHDVARLTRRPRWVLCGLALVNRFPRKKRFRGRLVGWCRAEVLEWMTRELSVETEIYQRSNGTRRSPRLNAQQECLPLECGSRCTRARDYSERAVRRGLSPQRFSDGRNPCKGP
jgi:predicted DNA-binding transcriptional regulator AlpA